MPGAVLEAKGILKIKYLGERTAEVTLYKPKRIFKISLPPGYIAAAGQPDSEVNG
jgi:hypothetical protein